MPSISEFYGIKIYMYRKDNERHFTPHIHAFYAEFQAAIDFDGKILGGKIPKTAHKLIRKWLLENRSSLNYAWDIATKSTESIPKIKGLD
jgi:hypothetical protein